MQHYDLWLCEGIVYLVSKLWYAVNIFLFTVNGEADAA